MARVLVAMSGGVDSSVAAALLKERGFEVIGVTMRFWSKEECDYTRFHERSCCSLEGIEFARKAASVLGIPHYVVNASEVFRKFVIQDFVSEYARGRTPNPCVRCNQFVKFRWLLQYALKLGCEYLATGHYARIREGRLLMASDREKDQSYFLWPIRREDLGRILFPIGDYRKSEVRELARRLGLPTAERPESQDICFIPDGDYASYVAKFSPEALKPGPVYHVDGRLLGRHRGIARYTVGQRLEEVGGLGARLYVKEIDAPSATLKVAERYRLFAVGLRGSEANWLVDPPSGWFRAEAAVRHGPERVRSKVRALEGGQIEVLFFEPIWAPAPGQSVVLYDGESVLGGAVIDEILWERD
ncbi:MAG TPA: tRNA 2-thiouridine(34) synthase MnmA [Armatimonadetes bacterium]|nr:tRNA 2-thiouridine(34) synthase MnmA [Armatimonadota bacterium]